MGNILLGAKAYICDEHDFVANKRKVLLLVLRVEMLLSLNCREMIITLDIIQLLQNYSQAPISGLYSSSTLTLSCIYFQSVFSF